jgi:lysyl-tRNA synthetase class 2
MADPSEPSDSQPEAEQGPQATAADLVADRQRKRQRLREEFNVDPYGQRVDGLVSLAKARQRYDAEADEAAKSESGADRRPRVRVAGRVMQHRVLGNLIFMQLRDSSGDIQVAVSKKQWTPSGSSLRS